MRKRQTNMTLPVHVIELLDAKAQDMMISRSAVVSMILSEWYKKQPEAKQAEEAKGEE